MVQNIISQFLLVIVGSVSIFCINFDILRQNIIALLALEQRPVHFGLSRRPNIFFDIFFNGVTEKLALYITFPAGSNRFLGIWKPDFTYKSFLYRCRCCLFGENTIFDFMLFPIMLFTDLSFE